MNLPSNEKRKEEEPGSLLGAMLNRIRVNSEFNFNLLIGIEASLAVLISVYFSLMVGIMEAGLASLALASAAIVPRVNQILRYNRERIWEKKTSPYEANRQSILSGVVLLISMVITYGIIASLTDKSILAERFTFVGVTYTDALLTPDRFSRGMEFFFHNSRVMFLFILLSFVYRSLGTSLALGWNAGVWTVTIILMVRTGMGESDNSFVYSLVAFAAIAPHLIIEGLAYITGSLAGIFVSRGLTLYEKDPLKLRRVLRASLLLVVIAFVILATAALIEHFWAPWMLQFI